ncbi:MAG: oligosaccharide flippase family protein [Nitrospirae bacterium]|nr:oligosaccharide flippase family protein [Nitrospirota bacterium]
MFKSTIKKNVIANLTGKAWSGLIQLVFVPLYIKFLGMEAFGLIGFFIMLQGLLSVLDLGLSTTLNRELACRSANGNAQEAKDIVRTMEWIYWSIAIVIAVGIIVVAPWIGRSWVNAKGLPAQSVQNAIVLMGLVAAAQWPFSLYSGGLMGLQKQVLLNTIRILMATIQAGGAVLVLWLFSSSIEAYFTWQIGIVGIQTVLTGYFLRSSLPKSAKAPTFSRDLLRQCWRFAAGMTGISAVATILTQIDKVILSKLLSLEQFGYYMLAFTMGSTLMFLVSPVSAALFPKLSELVAAEKTEELIRLYHKGCQAVSLFTFPVGILIAFFPQEILMLWTRDSSIVKNTHLLLSLAIVGCVLNAAVTMPYMLQLAYGWTSLSFYKNIIAIIILIPLLVFLIHYIGAVGGAITWVLLNAGYILFEIPLMHCRLMRREMKRWYIIDVGLPAACCVIIGVILKMLFTDNVTTLTRFIAITIPLGSMFLACALALPFSRDYLRRINS